MRALVFAVVAVTCVVSSSVRADDDERDLNEATVAQLQAMMSSGELTSKSHLSDS